METHLFQTTRGEIRGLSWGCPGAPFVLAVHGGFGVAENFIEIGEHLGENYRVLALDLPGRGKSFWSANPERDYRLPVFADLIREIIDELGVEKLCWIGTSMGGVLGIHAASGPLAGRVTHLVMNDIGPTLPDELAEPIGRSMGSQPHFLSLGEVAAYLKTGLGELAGPERDAAFWCAKAACFARRLPDGGYTLHQDPKIESHIVHGRCDFEVWEQFVALPARIMLIHGWKSSIVTPEIVERMRVARVDLVVADYREWGHAPFLDRAEDALLIDRFFNPGAGVH
ncbi:MAG: alpha/beta fold hydrolase [Sphingomonadales bacterium]|nr:alpha/beta fold hydrolase [Sphingomonadales bacterium]